MDREKQFETAQKEFINWTSKWIHLNQTENSIAPDVIELAALLQIFGYNIRFFDAVDVQGIAPIQNGNRGLKMMITCGHSGLRCILESPSKCHCPENIAESVKWEISGTAPKLIKEEIKESGSDLLLPIPKVTQTAIRTVMNHLFHMMIYPSKDINQNSLSTPLKTPMETSAMSLNPIAINPTINIKSPEPPMSPTRYRSLDTLTETVDLIQFSSPGLLKKTSEKSTFLSLTMSSPNLYPSGQPSMKSISVDSISSLKDEYTKMKHIQELVNDVVSMYEEKQGNLPLHFDVSIIKGSAESLPVIQAVGIKTGKSSKTHLSGSSPNISTGSKIKSVKPKCRLPSRATSIKKTASSSKTKPNTITTTNMPSSLQAVTPANTLLKRTRIATSSAGVTNLKYSHISTIPKNISKK